jgi:hypothetical protein
VGYVLAAYGLVIGALLAYGLYLAGERRALRRNLGDFEDPR